MSMHENNEINQINCIYNKTEQTISLLHNCLVIEKNKDYIDIYVNGNKIDFSTKYTSNEIGELNVKFIFHKLLTSTSFMFYKCISLESIDLTSFNTTNVTKMSLMFSGCSSLKSIDVSRYNTANVIDMNSMFYECSSLKF